MPKVVVEDDSDSDTYSEGYETDDTLLAYDTADCEEYRSDRKELVCLQRLLNYSYYLKKSVLYVIGKRKRLKQRDTILISF